MAILAIRYGRAGRPWHACDFIQSQIIQSGPRGLTAFCSLTALPVVLQHLDGLRMHFLARLQAAAVADDHRFAFREARDNFRLSGGFAVPV